MTPTDRQCPAVNGAPPKTASHRPASHTITEEDTPARLSTVDDATLIRLSQQLTRAARGVADLPPGPDTERLVFLTTRVRRELRHRRAARRVAEALAEADRLIGGGFR